MRVQVLQGCSEVLTSWHDGMTACLKILEVRSLALVVGGFKHLEKY